MKPASRTLAIIVLGIYSLLDFATTASAQRLKTAPDFGRAAPHGVPGTGPQPWSPGGSGTGRSGSSGGGGGSDLCPPRCPFGIMPPGPVVDLDDREQELKRLSDSIWANLRSGGGSGNVGRGLEILAAPWAAVVRERIGDSRPGYLEFGKKYEITGKMRSVVTGCVTILVAEANSASPWFWQRSAEAAQRRIVVERAVKLLEALKGRAENETNLMSTRDERGRPYADTSGREALAFASGQALQQLYVIYTTRCWELPQGCE